MKIGVDEGCSTMPLQGVAMERYDALGSRSSRDSDAGLRLTLAENAGRNLAEWIADHRDDPGAGGVRVLKDRKTVLVYWKGAVPAGLQRLAASQAVPVTFQPAAYSRAELTAAVIAVMDTNPDVSAAGSEPDYSGISVVVSSKAPANAFAQVKATSSVPVALRWIGDPTPLRNTKGEAGNSS